jgi:hypothetical protein
MIIISTKERRLGIGYCLSDGEANWSFDCEVVVNILVDFKLYLTIYAGFQPVLDSFLFETGENGLKTTTHFAYI